MWIRHLSSLQFLTYVAFFAVVVASIVTIVPGRAGSRLFRHQNTFSMTRVGSAGRFATPLSIRSNV